MNLEVVTPTGSVLSRSVKEVIVPATDGLMGILEGHADIMVGLGDGRLSINDGNESIQADLKGGGFLQVDGDRVYVLAEFVYLVN
jgi:F-type H+-transporting ATPase subunit epsilon